MTAPPASTTAFALEVAVRETTTTTDGPRVSFFEQLDDSAAALAFLITFGALPIIVICCYRCFWRCCGGAYREWQLDRREARIAKLKDEMEEDAARRARMTQGEHIKNLDALKILSTPAPPPEIDPSPPKSKRDKLLDGTAFAPAHELHARFEEEHRIAERTNPYDPKWRYLEKKTKGLEPSVGHWRLVRSKDGHLAYLDPETHEVRWPGPIWQVAPYNAMREVKVRWKGNIVDPRYVER